MRILKKIVRISGLVIFIILACMGVGIFGGILPNNRERFMDNEVRVEMVDAKKEDNGATELGDKT